MIDISKGRYWDLPWSSGRFRLASCIATLPVRVRNIMLFGMTVETQRFPIRYIIAKLGKFREFFDVVRVNVAASFVATSTACKMVPPENVHPPFTVSGDGPCHSYFFCYSTFPVWVMRSIERSIPICALGFAKIAKHLFMRFSQRNPLAPFIGFATRRKCFPHCLSYVGRFPYFHIPTFSAMDVESIVTRFIKSKLLAGLPCLAFLATLLSLTKQQIFIKGEAELPCPSSENSHSLRRHCFHGLSQYYTGGYCYVK